MTKNNKFTFKPSINSLKELKNIANFKIKHNLYGMIEFCEPVDLTGLRLLDIVRME